MWQWEVRGVAMGGKGCGSEGVKGVAMGGKGRGVAVREVRSVTMGGKGCGNGR